MQSIYILEVFSFGERRFTNEELNIVCFVKIEIILGWYIYFLSG